MFYFLTNSIGMTPFSFGKAYTILGKIQFFDGKMVKKAGKAPEEVGKTPFFDGKTLTNGRTIKI